MIRVYGKEDCAKCKNLKMILEGRQETVNDDSKQGKNYVGSGCGISRKSV